MDINSFVERFAAQFDETEASKFRAETKFRDLDEWSSLMALSIIAMIDEEYKIEIKGDDIRNSQTIEDLFNIIKIKI
jgi:acyl carrier protein